MIGIDRKIFIFILVFKDSLLSQVIVDRQEWSRSVVDRILATSRPSETRRWRGG
jgi:hypothetical protein